MEEMMKKIKALNKEQQLDISKEMCKVTSENDIVTLFGKYDINITVDMAKKALEKMNEVKLSDKELQDVNAGVNWNVFELLDEYMEDWGRDVNIF